MKKPRHLSKALLGAFFLSALCVTATGQAPVESPVGTFVFYTPEAPPEAPYPITEMAYLEGSYVDDSGGFYLDVTVDLAMDESGKVLAMGILPGFTDKKDVKAGMTEDSDLVRTMYVRTINGEPVLTANASAKGEYGEGEPMPKSGLARGETVEEDASVKGKGQADIFLGSFPPFTDPFTAVVPVMSSFKGTLEGDKEKEKPSMSFLFLDPEQVRNLTTKEWFMVLEISEKLDSRERPFYVATLSLTKPDGTSVSFSERRVKYSAKGGYTVSFTNGTQLINGESGRGESNGSVVDKTTKVKFSNLLFKKVFKGDSAFFEPAAGGVDYDFLGQKGFGHIFNFDTFGGTTF